MHLFNFVQQHHKFVSALTADSIGITNPVPVKIVDVLKAVQIQKQ